MEAENRATVEVEAVEAQAHARPGQAAYEPLGEAAPGTGGSAAQIEAPSRHRATQRSEIAREMIHAQLQKIDRARLEPQRGAKRGV